MNAVLPAAVAALLLAGGCAEMPQHPPAVVRISAEELAARLPQPANSMSLAEIVDLSRGGVAAAEIVRRLDEAHARYRLSATQVVELQQQGVALTVLDHLVERERRALFEDFAAEVTRREQACTQRLAQELNLCRLQAAPLIWPQHPFINCWPPVPGAPFWRCF